VFSFRGLTPIEGFLLEFRIRPTIPGPPPVAVSSCVVSVLVARRSRRA
jgi:hypothetical protein